MRFREPPPPPKPPEDSDPVPARPPTEEERTLSFIEERLRAAGLNEMQAEAVARNHREFDWHDVVRALEAGADPGTVTDIYT